MPQSMQCESSTTIGSDVMCSPMEMQPFLQASWHGLQGMFWVHSITGCTPAICVTPG